MAVAVVGIGNLLMGDDGVGVRVLQWLQQRYTFPAEVQLLDGGTKSIELLPYLEEADRVIFIDAVDLGETPGTVVEVSGQAVAEYFNNKLSVHQIGLPDLIGAMLLRDSVPEEMVLIGVQPGYTELQWGLTEEVSGAVQKAADMVIEKLRQWGMEVAEATHGAEAGDQQNSEFKNQHGGY